MPTDPKLVRDRFLAAAELPAAERGAYLAANCGDDAELRGAVERLLAAHEQPASVLNRPVPGGLEQTQAFSPREQPGTVIAGRYKLLEEIGEGGMGTVWVAEQTEPVRRKVALKLIKAGMDSKSVLARFEAERQALAVMDHPNIAKVFDGGLTDAGRPYFVMEYVKGVPITDYCDATRLSVQERLHLFVQVCQAVQHAHQKGIIHRDLKPSNILVAPYDDLPVPKVIDFGLAKAMHQSLTERTLHTAHETVLGTPLYMSPEQAQLNNLDVDTRSDIYSLGVLLYELLTGTTPLEKQRFKEAAWDEIKRIIREEEPPRPSMRLSSAQTLPSLAAGRQIEPARLTKLVRGELDWIVMKALEKDRTRRYETANGFAADVHRYLAGEPVLAAPPSTSYRVRKFVRKHRAALTTVATIGLLLVAGVAVSTWQAVRATRAEAAARLAELDARQAQQAEAERAEGERLAKLDAQEKEKLAVAAADKERAARLEEERQRKFAEAISQFVKDDFLALTSVEGQDRFGGAGKEALSKNTTLRELLDRAAVKLRARKDLDPRIEAELCWIVGVNYRGAGEAEKGIAFLERAVSIRSDLLGRDHADTLNAMNSLGVLYNEAGKTDKALPLLEETLKLYKAKLGTQHPGTLYTTGNLAGVYMDVLRHDLALSLYEETVQLTKAKLGPEHPQTLNTMNNLAEAYREAGKVDKALPLSEETLKLTKAKLGPDHLHTLTCMGNLALAYMSADKDDKALPLLEETLKLKKAKLGPEHPDTLNTMGNLAAVYHRSGRLDLALPLDEETLKLRKAKLGPEHPATLRGMHDLAGTYQAAGRLDLALPLYEETLKLQKAKLGPEHPQTLTCMGNLVLAYHLANKPDPALPLLEEMLKLKKAKLGPDHPDTLNAMNQLVGAYQAARKHDLCPPLLEEMLKLRKAKLGPDHPETLNTMNQLASAYYEAGRFDLALPLFKEVLTKSRKTLHMDSPQLAQQLASLSMALLQTKAYAEAEPLLRESLAIRETKEPDAWTTFNTKSLLGGALLGQKKYADPGAPGLLLAGYEGMKQREAQIPEQGKSRLTEALDRLIDLYTVTDKPDEVTKWQAERATYSPPASSATDEQ